MVWKIIQTRNSELRSYCFKKRNPTLDRNTCTNLYGEKVIFELGCTRDYCVSKSPVSQFPTHFKHWSLFPHMEIQVYFCTAFCRMKLSCTHMYAPFSLEFIVCMTNFEMCLFLVVYFSVMCGFLCMFSPLKHTTGLRCMWFLR